MTAWVASVATGALAALLAFGVARRLTLRPGRLVRTNVSGRPVPVVLGVAVFVSAHAMIGAIPAAAYLWPSLRPTVSLAAVTSAAFVMGVAGLWDDFKDDERARGFGGHLRALRRGRVTGGVVKMLAGVAAGAIASMYISARGASDIVHAVAVVLLVALAANLVNLFDRAPGRAAKVVLGMAAGLGILGSSDWLRAAAPHLGALIGVFPLDLKERGMLGDAGSNALGAALGVGFAISLGTGGRWVAIAVLAALNLASERWSFSDVIARTRPLRAVDSWGRSRSRPD